MKKILTLLLVLFATQTHAATLTGRVVKVLSGDTLIVLEGTTHHQIKLLGIDAPEHEQPFANRSKQALTNNVAGKTVEVKYDQRDHYQRILGQVIYMGYDINLRQLELGMAWHLAQYEHEESSKYAQAELIAQRDKVGLWRDQNPVAPWDFRKAEENK